MTLPAPPAAACSYDETRAYEAALLDHAAIHGHTPETLCSLSNSAASRCAYREAIAWQHQAVTRWPEIDNPLTGLNGRLHLIQIAVHAAQHEEAAFWLDDIAGDPAIVNAGTAQSILTLARGLGLSAGLRQILSRCVQYLDTASPAGSLGRLLHDDGGANEELVGAVRLISLGEGCYGWIQPNRYLLRSADEVDLAMPFNMMVVPESGLVSALEEGGAGLSDAADLGIIRMIRDIPVPRHARYGILFNHECDDHFLRDNMAELRALYRRRIRSFLQHGCGQPRVYLGMASEFEHVQRLEHAIAALAKDDRYRLLLIAHCIGASPRWPERLQPTTRVAHIPLPHVGYNWTTDANTTEGYRYDLAVYRLIRETMYEAANL